MDAPTSIPRARRTELFTILSRPRPVLPCGKMRRIVIREIREFCEDNNRQPPAAMRSVPPRTELTHWSAADPALEIEADPAVELRGPTGRVCYLQRVVYDIRYLLVLDNGTEFERGESPDITFALEVARVWLGGGGLDDLPKPRKYWL